MTVKTENDDEADEADAEREDEGGEGEEKPMTWPLEIINTVQQQSKPRSLLHDNKKKGLPNITCGPCLEIVSFISVPRRGLSGLCSAHFPPCPWRRSV